jgi:hypothetical protein
VAREYDVSPRRWQYCLDAGSTVLDAFFTRSAYSGGITCQWPSVLHAKWIPWQEMTQSCNVINTKAYVYGTTWSSLSSRVSTETRFGPSGNQNAHPVCHYLDSLLHVAGGRKV